MDKFIVSREKNVFYKNVLFGENNILASDEDYGSEAAFREKLAGGKKGKLDTHLNVAYTTIQKIVPFSQENTIQVFFDKGKAGFALPDAITYQEVLEYLLSRTALQQTTETYSSTISIIKPALYTLVAAIFSVALVVVARGLENGEHITAGGSRRGFKRLLIGLAEAIGFWGAVASGVLVIAGFVYYTATQYKNAKVVRPVYK